MGGIIMDLVVQHLIRNQITETKRRYFRHIQKHRLTYQVRLAETNAYKAFAQLWIILNRT